MIQKNRTLSYPKVDKLTFFRGIIELLREEHPLKRLTPRGRELLSYIIYYNDKYKHLNEDDRAAIITSDRVRNEIKIAMDIQPDTFNNLVSKVNHSGCLKDNLPVIGLQFYPDINFTLTFKFQINEADSTI